MEERVCELKKEKTVNTFLMENDEMIYKTKYLIEQIKGNILGNDEAISAENPSPTCLMHVLEIQNYNLRNILDNLEIIMKTLKPNN